MAALRLAWSAVLLAIAVGAVGGLVVVFALAFRVWIP